MASIKKIAIIGPESSGKSTLAAALACELGTVWVPEFARQYLQGRNGEYKIGDLKEIAFGQNNLERLAEQAAKNYLICDTDLYVIKVWSEIKFGSCDPIILQIIAQQHYQLYVVTTPDIEWQYDPLRENPSLSDRLVLFNIYKDIAINSGTPFIVVSGPVKSRIQQCLSAIKHMLG